MKHFGLQLCFVAVVLLASGAYANAALVLVSVPTANATATISSGTISYAGGSGDTHRSQEVLVLGSNVHLGTYTDTHGAGQGLAGKWTATAIQSGYDTALDADIVMDAAPIGGTAPYTGYLKFDLGSSKTIAAMQIWNCNWNFDGTQHPYLNGPTSFVLEVSNTGLDGSWTTLNGGTALTLAQLGATSTTYLGDTYAFSGTTQSQIPTTLGGSSGGGGTFRDYSGVTVSGRYIRLDMPYTDAGGWGQKLMLDAVQFYVVPEPATMALLALGGLGLLARRRRG